MPAVSTRVRRRSCELESLAGLSAVEAIGRLRELELRPAVEPCESPSGEDHGRVVAHDPEAGATVARGALVTLLISQAQHAPALSQPGAPATPDNTARPARSVRSASPPRAQQPVAPGATGPVRLPAWPPEPEPAAAPARGRARSPVAEQSEPAGSPPASDEPTAIDAERRRQPRPVRSAAVIAVVSLAALVAVIGFHTAAPANTRAGHQTARVPMSAASAAVSSVSRRAVGQPGRPQSRPSTPRSRSQVDRPRVRRKRASAPDARARVAVSASMSERPLVAPSPEESPAAGQASSPEPFAEPVAPVSPIGPAPGPPPSQQGGIQ